MRIQTKHLTTLLAMAGLGLAATASATTVVRVPLDELTRGSDLVIQARVVGVWTTTARDDERNISTSVRLAVTRVLKGHQSAPFLTLNLRGGSKGAWTLRVPGTPSFTRGEEVVLFLESTSRGYRPAGLAEGKFTVTREPASGRARARRSLDGVLVMERTPSGRLEAAAGPQTHVDDDMYLDDLLDTIRQAVRGSKGGAQ